MKAEGKDLRGEYDPPYDFESEPTEEDIEKAEKIIEKYERKRLQRAALNYDEKVD